MRVILLSIIICLMLVTGCNRQFDSQQSKVDAYSDNESTEMKTQKTNNYICSNELVDNEDNITSNTDIISSNEDATRQEYLYPVLSDVYTGTEFTQEELEEIDNFINDEVSKGFPGAVLLIAKNKQIAKHTSYGYSLKYDGLELLQNPVQMNKDTLFDLASVSKVFGTVFGLMKLETDGDINSEDSVSKYLNGFNSTDKKNMRMEHLLTHTSGFPASVAMYYPNNTLGDDFYSLDRNKTMSLLYKIPLDYETGSKSVYSDIGFMTLGCIIETVSGVRMDDYVENNIYKPIGLSKTLYSPLKKGIEKSEFAATERCGNTRDNRYSFNSVRKHTLQGEVHDELAYYAMNEVSGSAGLFSNAYELAVLSQMILNKGVYGNAKIFDESVVEKYTTPSKLYSRYCLGWDYGGSDKNNYRYGPYASNKAFGKTGWTGTVVLIDPEYDLIIVLLTNKRHSPFEGDDFVGASFETGKYASIITKVYEKMLDINK